MPTAPKTAGAGGPQCGHGAARAPRPLACEPWVCAAHLFATPPTSFTAAKHTLGVKAPAGPDRRHVSTPRATARSRVAHIVRSRLRALPEPSHAFHSASSLQAQASCLIFLRTMKMYAQAPRPEAPMLPRTERFCPVTTEQPSKGPDVRHSNAKSTANIGLCSRSSRGGQASRRQGRRRRSSLIIARTTIEASRRRARRSSRRPCLQPILQPPRPSEPAHGFGAHQKLTERLGFRDRT
jgi:hypothetical protein